MDKMTMPQFLNAVANTKDIAPELADFARAEIAKIKDKNEKRRNMLTAAQKANAKLLDTVIATMSAETVVTAAEISKRYNVSVQRASAILVNGVKSGVLTATTVKSKSGKVKGYSLVMAEAETVSEVETEPEGDGE